MLTPPLYTDKNTVDPWTALLEACKNTANFCLPLRHPTCLWISLYPQHVFPLILHRSHLYAYLLIFTPISNYILTFQRKCLWLFIVTECHHITYCSKKLTISRESINSAIKGFYSVSTLTVTIVQISNIMHQCQTFIPTSLSLSKGKI